MDTAWSVSFTEEWTRGPGEGQELAMETALLGKLRLKILKANWIWRHGRMVC